MWQLEAAHKFYTLLYEHEITVDLAFYVIYFDWYS